MNDQTRNGEGEPEPRAGTIKRRDSLLGLGKWSSAVIGGLLMPGQNDSAKASGAWVTRRGGWVNGAGVHGGEGGAAWVNGGGGGCAAWVNVSGGTSHSDIRSRCLLREAPPWNPVQSATGRAGVQGGASRHQGR